MALFLTKIVNRPARFRNALPGRIERICSRRHIPVVMRYLGVGHSHGHRRTPFKSFQCPICGKIEAVAVDERTGRLFTLFIKN